MSKKCKECENELPLSHYHFHANTRDKLQPKCKDCVKAYRAAYYQKHQDRLKAYSVNFYAENSDHVKTYQKKYAAKNTKKVKARSKRWREANRESLLVQKREYYETNKSVILPKLKLYSAAHPEYLKASTARRRSILRKASGSCSSKQMIAKCEYHGWQCYLCGTPVTMKTLHMDHRTPIARGGSNWPANLAPACVPCNLSKSRKTEKEYRAFRQSL